jgi:hypothetical protein
MNAKRYLFLVISCLIVLLIVSTGITWAKDGAAGFRGPQASVGTGFTYQGQLRDGKDLADGVFDFQFQLYDDEDSGTLLGTVNKDNETVSDGLFAVTLDFGDVFDGDERWLAIGVRPGAEDGAYAPLPPRQPLSPAPYAIFALEAGSMPWSGLTGIPLGFADGTDDGLTSVNWTDVGNRPAGLDDGDDDTTYTDGAGLTLDGTQFSAEGTPFENVVVVAKSGGDYTSVQAAINSITDATANNPYLVWVAPGVYNETVTLKSFVHLQGAGQDATVITSNASSSGDWPPAQATLKLASDTSLRDLTLGNSGTGEHNVALLATTGMTGTLVADVATEALGSGTNNLAIFLSGNGTGITMQQVTALAENASNLNAGLINHSQAGAGLIGGNYTARGGTYAWGIFLVNGMLKATNVTALGENGSNTNQGLHNYNNSIAVLYGGEYTGRGGNQTQGTGASNNSSLLAYNVSALAENGSGEVGNYGIGVYDNSNGTLHGGVFIARGGVNNYALSNEFSATLKAENVTALAENGSTGNYGFHNANNAQAVIHDASFTGRGGVDAYGIKSYGDSTTLEAESVAALGEIGSNYNYGLLISDTADATVSGGSFMGIGGTGAFGIVIAGSDTTLEASSVTALGKDGSDVNFGMVNNNAATAMLSGGTFTGRGGGGAVGIVNLVSGSKLEASNVTALGENGTNNNRGIENHSDAEAMLHGGTYTGRGGGSAKGIDNHGTSTMLDAENVTALAEDGSNSNYGLINIDTLTVTLQGGAFNGRGGTNAYGIYNNGIMLEAESVIALGENASSNNYGIYNKSAAMLHGGTFTGRSGEYTRGIMNSNSTELEATNVTALGEGSSNANYGLDNSTTLSVTLHGGSFTGRGGNNAYGINSSGGNPTLDAMGVTALGEDGSSYNLGLSINAGTAWADSSQFAGSSYGLWLSSGTVYLGVSLLDGGAYNPSSSLTCYGVYDESYTPYTCP